MINQEALYMVGRDNYEQLANAVILKAVDDYRAAWKKIKYLPEDKRKSIYEEVMKLEEEKNSVEYRLKLKRVRRKTAQEKAVTTFYECEDFFRSRWFGVLTALDGDKLIRMLREE